ncbi:uncharacterized protein LOC110850158 isoform X2 [Folsomia candida]|nr:uncharacterized protein LOC110850158 isoform X2 [Folsomia candida]
MEKLTIYLFLVVFATTAKGQERHYNDMGPVDEDTPPRRELLTLQLGVKFTVTPTRHYHNGYMTLSRRSEYELSFTTSDTFPNFIANERTNNLTISVDFTFEDGTVEKNDFGFTVIDKNNHEPVFTGPSVVRFLYQPKPGQSYIDVETWITVADEDLGSFGLQDVVVVDDEEGLNIQLVKYALYGPVSPAA